MIWNILQSTFLVEECNVKFVLLLYKYSQVIKMIIIFQIFQTMITVGANLPNFNPIVKNGSRDD